MRVAIYTRVSTEEQHINGLSLAAQRKALEDYANNLDYTVVGVYSDEGISARKPMSYRKELLRLLDDVKLNKIDMILVTKLDRWFRNIKDYNITEEILNAHNCYWKTIFESYDSSDANGQMVINIMLSVNQAECDRTSERIKAVMNYKKSIGEVTSGKVACYGYYCKDGKLYKDPVTAPVVEEMFDRYLKTINKRGTYDYLLSRFGGLVPPFNTYMRLFYHTHYYGTVQGNENVCEPYITKSQHDFIVSKRSVSYARKNHYLFAALIKCPICGKTLYGYSHRYKGVKGVTYNPYYRCFKHYRKKSDCTYSGAISQKTVEKYVLANIESELDKYIIKINQRTKSINLPCTSDSIRSEMERLNNLYIKGRINPEYYENEYDSLQLKLESLKTVDIKPPVAADIISGDWFSLYSQLDDEHKNVFWRTIIDKITMDPVNRKLNGLYFI